VLALWEAGRAGRLNPLLRQPKRVWARSSIFADGRSPPPRRPSRRLGGLALGIVVGVLLGVAAALFPLLPSWSR
jgi:hypothetical protein